LRTENREQRTENREQRTENREQRISRQIIELFPKVSGIDGLKQRLMRRFGWGAEELQSNRQVEGVDVQINVKRKGRLVEAEITTNAEFSSIRGTRSAHSYCSAGIYTKLEISNDGRSYSIVERNGGEKQSNPIEGEHYYWSKVSTTVIDKRLDLIFGN